MRLTRCYVALPMQAGARVVLPELVANHLARVLRLREGDACVLFNGDGQDHDGRIASIGKREVVVELQASRAVDNESPLHVTLLQGIARGEKMDLILQKATELGVACIAPIVTERTEVKLDGERSDKKMAHWRGVLASACEQSGRAVLPKILEPQSLANFVAGDNNDRRFVLDPDAEHSLGTAAIARDSSLALVIGPEGGLSERDLAALRAGKFEGLRLGPRILRTETAGLAAMAGLQALYGDWR